MQTFVFKEFDLLTGTWTGRSETYGPHARVEDAAAACAYTRSLKCAGWLVGRSGRTVVHPSGNIAWCCDASLTTEAIAPDPTMRTGTFPLQAESAEHWFRARLDTLKRLVASGRASSLVSQGQDASVVFHDYETLEAAVLAAADPDPYDGYAAWLDAAATPQERSARKEAAFLWAYGNTPTTPPWRR